MFSGKLIGDTSLTDVDLCEVCNSPSGVLLAGEGNVISDCLIRQGDVVM